MFAIVEAYKLGLLKFNNWPKNIISGLIVGVVALPLAMAFAIASGVKPEQGIYTAIIAALVVGVFGGSRVQIAGPTGAFVVILASITARYGVEGLQIASLLAGFILLFMGIVKLGNVIKFIPDPVIVGFTSGIGFIIFIGEWKDFFGLTVTAPVNAHFYQKLYALFLSMPHVDYSTTGLGLLSLFLILMTPKLVKRIPGPLVAMIVVTVIQAHFQFKSVSTLGSAFGGIPEQLPHFHIPAITFNRIVDLMGPAFTIALLGAIESLLSATAADNMAKTKHHSNQELIGQGLANIFTPLWGGFAATGAIARTATNVKNGGNSPLSAICHSVFLILVIVLLAPLAAYIPLCTLAAILFVVAYNMSDIPHFVYMMKHAPHYDVLILLTTFLLTIFTDLVVAVNVGVILAMMFFVRRMNQSVVIEQQHHDTLQSELAQNGFSALPDNTNIYTIEGPFFFGVAEKLERSLAETASKPENIIFRLKHVPFMDMTGLETFYKLIKDFYKRGINVYLCESNSKLTHKLETLGILQWVCSGKIYCSLTEIIKVMGD